MATLQNKYQHKLTITNIQKIIKKNYKLYQILLTFYLEFKHYPQGKKQIN